MPDETNINPTPTSVSTEAPAAADSAAVATPAEVPSLVVAPIETITPPVITPPTPPTPVSPPTPTPTTDNPVRSLLAKALAKIQFRKQAKLEKIMVLARERGQVANDDVQKLLRVSDATATRYLAQLAKAGRLQRAGVRGGAVYRFVQ